VEQASEDWQANVNPVQRWLCPVLLTAVALCGCSWIAGPEDVLELEVYEARVACMGEGPRQCLLVRPAGEAEVGLWYDDIDGFTWEPGYRYRLQVRVKRIANPPADGSSRAYTLHRVRSRVLSPYADLLEQVRAAEATWTATGPAQYTMVQRVDCFCAEAGIGAVQVDVVALQLEPGVRFEDVREVRRVDTGEVLAFEEATRYLGVVHLYRYIYWSIARDAERIDVELNDASGYPVRVSVDPRSAVSDDELEYNVDSITAR
jgi:hypothetical protein